MQLAGKAALISGAGGGICRAIAVACAEAGAAVACCDLKPEAAAETARLVTAAGGRALSQVCDVASEAATRDVANAAHDAFGRLDILVHGAAPHDPSGTVLETTLADWQRVLDINLTGAFLLSRAVLPHMIAAEGGSIIFIASQLGRVGSAGRAAYCATKGALIQLAKVMAIDHSAQNIRVKTANDPPKPLKWGRELQDVRGPPPEGVALIGKGPRQVDPGANKEQRSFQSHRCMAQYRKQRGVPRPRIHRVAHAARPACHRART